VRWKQANPFRTLARDYRCQGEELGRGVEPQDMPLIRAIDREAARINNRFSAIVLGIVKSDAFQMNSK
jgi:hypothetical protein